MSEHEEREEAEELERQAVRAHGVIVSVCLAAYAVFLVFAATDCARHKPREEAPSCTWL